VKLRVRSGFIIYVLVSVVLGWTMLTAVRVTMTTRYSLRRVLVEDGANKMLDVWGALEQNFQRREDAVRSRFQRDPLWPVTVARTERQSAAARATGNVSTAVRSRSAAAAASKLEATLPPPPSLPRVMAVLFDREARALVNYEGANRLVRAGDRLGPLLVTHVAREGVTVDLNGKPRLLHVR